MIIHLKKLKAIVDKGGRLWLPLSELEGYTNPELIESDDEYYEVQGYSDKRKAYWLEKITIESMADNIEEELEEYVKCMGDGES